MVKPRGRLARFRGSSGQLPSLVRPFIRILAATMCIAGVVAPGSAQAAASVELTGEPTSTGLSGFPGSKFTLGDADSKTRALVGVLSRERSDNPCSVSVGWEDVNQPSVNGALSKELCGDNGPSSATMGGTFGPADRVFITGAQVCMNKADDRVKGIHLRGQRINDAGSLVDFGPDAQDARTNCHQDHWKRWVNCPAGQVATAAVIHFEAGKTPRSWTGISLQCRGLRVTGTTTISSAVPASTKGIAAVTGCSDSEEKDIRAVAWNIANDWGTFAKSVESATGKNVGSCLERRFSETGKVRCESQDVCKDGGCRQGHSWPGKDEIKIYPDFLQRIKNYAQADRRACFAALMAHEFTHVCWFAEGRPEAREDAAFAYWQKRFPGTPGFNVNNSQVGCGLD